MFKNVVTTMKLLSVLSCFVALNCHAAESTGGPAMKHAVDTIVQSFQHKNGIPGIAVAVTLNGKQTFYNYGVMSTQTRRPVGNTTLFEIGSLSKTFAATVVAYARNEGKLALSDNVSEHLPPLRGSSFDNISLLDMGTHASGLPLFVPEKITNDSQLFDYLEHWKPSRPAGTHRIYSNVGIGTLGLIAAQSLGVPYDQIVQERLFPALGMKHSYLHVPADRMNAYAQGYTTKDVPIRLHAGALASETYGVRSCTEDLIRFIDANMQTIKVDPKWRDAINDTHTGYFQAGELIQDLIWEQFPYPADLKKVLSGNAELRADTPATRFTPPLAPRGDVIINKTGSTNGFSAYAIFIPARKIGVVLLANKSVSIDQRVTAAYRILMELDRATSS
jgi:beta-lactamase class C